VKRLILDREARWSDRGFDADVAPRLPRLGLTAMARNDRWMVGLLTWRWGWRGVGRRGVCVGSAGRAVVAGREPRGVWL